MLVLIGFTGQLKAAEDEDQVAEAMKALDDFMATFNSRDMDAWAKTLNYPHVRLANGRFTTTESRADFVRRGRQVEHLLEAEGWHHTLLTSIEAVHIGDDKVHLALRIDRCHADGRVYNSFDTLWVATLQDGHWGIQFRSSYLR